MRFVGRLGAVVPLLLTLILIGCSMGLTEAEEHNTGGSGLNREGSFQEAIAELDEAIRLDPEDAVLYNNRGFSYNNLGQYQRATQEFDEAIRLDPELADA